jgi:MerR family mercuric resistance operon transcriptional regulator
VPTITSRRARGSDGVLGIGALARASGVGIDTIRFWERQGLLPAPPRTAGGRRFYDRGAIDRLRFLRHARELGFPLAEIRTLLALAQGAAGGCSEVQALAARHLAGVRDRLERLRRMQAALEATLERCARGEGPPCPLIEALAAPDADPEAAAPSAQAPPGPSGATSRPARKSP